jgi:serine protease AprX
MLIINISLIFIPNFSETVSGGNLDYLQACLILVFKESGPSMKSKQIRSATWGRNILLSCLLAFVCSLAFAGQNGKIASELSGNQSSNQVNVIIQFNQIPTASHHRKVTNRGGSINRDLGNFKGGAYRIPASELAALANDPDVTHISVDHPLQGTASTIPIDYHTDTVNAPGAWSQGFTGAGIGVALIDSGIANVADLTAKNIVYSQDFTGLGSTVDQYGHGTHVAGILAGNGASSPSSTSFYTFKGVAPNVNIVNLRVLDENGSGTDSEVIAAIQKAIALKSTYNIRVINLSLGRPVYESYAVDPLCQAVEQAWKAGIVVVVAAGNYGRDNLAGTSGYGTITAPGNDPYVITVGAMNTHGSPSRNSDAPASYSSKGPTLYDMVVKPDLVAPGNGAVSLYLASGTLDQSMPANQIPYSLFQGNGSSSGSPYFAMSGTSMAAPVVSGVAALLLQQSSSLTPDQVKARLMKSACKSLEQYATEADAVSGTTYNVQSDIFTVGAGEVDIQGALSNTDLAPATVGSALSPYVGQNTSGQSVLTTSGSSILGSASNVNIWGTSAVWGSQILVTGTSAPGSNIIVWGTSIPANDIIVWGTNGPSSDIIVWGTGTPASDIIVWGTTTPNAIRDK